MKTHLKLIPKATDIPNFECNARLEIADNYGDNHVDMRCRLAPDHEGPHREEFHRDETPVVVTWYVDESRCSACEGRCFEGDDSAMDCKVCGGTGHKATKKL